MNDWQEKQINEAYEKIISGVSPGVIQEGIGIALIVLVQLIDAMRP